MRVNDVKCPRSPSAAILGCLTVVVTQDATDTLVALDGACGATDFLAGLNEPIRQPLMISFPVIMANVRNDGPTQHVFAKEDQTPSSNLARTCDCDVSPPIA
jgi:hypothetical protein